jgi:hypothetical protein
VLALAFGVLICHFCGEVADTDTWWHLKSGQYIVQQHKLPVPDPFAYTTYLWKPAYDGETTTRYFNLTHEWLAQVFLYGVYAAGGFPAMVYMRALWLAGFCGLAGWLVWLRTRGVYRAMGAALAVVTVAQNFQSDRPQYLSYVFLGITLAVLESRKRFWILPPLLLIWANAHGGFLLGWVAMGAYCCEALWRRARGKPAPDEKQLFGFSVGAALASGLNPNFFRVFEVMHYYRQSPTQTQLWEWQYPKFWEISPFSVLLFGAAVLLMLNWRRVRISDGILLLAFGAAGLTAYRNIILTAFIGSFLIASYLPVSRAKAGLKDWIAIGLLAATGYVAGTGLPPIGTVALLGIAVVLWDGRWAVLGEAALALLLALCLGMLLSHGAVQPWASTWRAPEATADFLLQHHIRGRTFNTYEQGGYLLWRLSPELQVFADGRALNEKVSSDDLRIAMNADGADGPSGEQLLRDYGIDVIVMDGFEPTSGVAYYLPAALADPAQKEWKLVYQDDHDIVFMRHPPPDVQPLNSFDALATMERQCAYLVRHGAPACSGGMWDVFTRIGDAVRAEKWAKVYEHVDTSRLTLRK